MSDISRNMKIDDYKKLFEIKHEGGWLDNNVWYAKCKICEKLIFDKYLIKNWYILDGDQRKKRFYAAIRHHINVYHHELIPSKRIKMLEKDVASNEALQFLKNFPFRPYIKEEKLNETHGAPLKFWKPGIIVLSNGGKEKQNKIV